MITPETMLIVAGAAFLLFGGKKLPELGRSLGHGIREFKQGTQGLKDELERSAHTPGGETESVRPAVIAVEAARPVSLPSAPVTRVIQLGEVQPRAAVDSPATSK